MAIKDYYKILNVKPDAPVTIIKQSYRKFAMKYHPDKNPGDNLSAAVFGEIAEAYSVLSDTSARKKYNDQRHHTATGEYAKPAETIESLVTKATLLKKQVQHINVFHFNRDALLYSIKQLLPNDVSVLLKTNYAQQKFFLGIIAWCSNMLSSYQTKNLYQVLQPLYEKHHWLQQQLQQTIKQQTKQEHWEKYKIILAVLIALLLCAVIFFVTKHNT